MRLCEVASLRSTSRLTAEHWVDALNAIVYAFTWEMTRPRRYGSRSVASSGAQRNVNRLVQLANLGTASGSATYYTYNAANELCTLHVVGGSFGGIQPGHTYFQYDATGNLTVQSEADGTTYFEYTPFNLVASIHHKDATWTRCWYDGQLRRSALEDPTHGLRYFTWDQNGLNLLSEQTSSGELTRRYTHGYTPISGIGSLTLATNPSTSSAASPFMDHRGTVLGVVDSVGLVTPYAYNAFGLALGDLATGPAVTHRWRYQTNWLSLDSDLNLSPTRSYSHTTGSFLQRDPLFVAPKIVRQDVLANSLGTTTSRKYVEELNMYAGIFARMLKADMLGFYEIEWEGDSFFDVGEGNEWTKTKKAQVQESLLRIKNKITTILGAWALETVALDALPNCPCKQEILTNVNFAKGIFESVSKDILGGRNLEIRIKSLGNDVKAKVNLNFDILIHDADLDLDAGWFSQGEQERDADLFHELTHIRNTLDDDTSTQKDYNNAHRLETIFDSGSLSSWIVFKSDIRKCSQSSTATMPKP